MNIFKIISNFVEQNDVDLHKNAKKNTVIIKTRQLHMLNYLSEAKTFEAVCSKRLAVSFAFGNSEENYYIQLIRLFFFKNQIASKS